MGRQTADPREHPGKSLRGSEIILNMIIIIIFFLYVCDKLIQENNINKTK